MTKKTMSSPYSRRWHCAGFPVIQGNHYCRWHRWDKAADILLPRNGLDQHDHAVRYANDIMTSMLPETADDGIDFLAEQVPPGRGPSMWRFTNRMEPIEVKQEA